MERKMMEKMGKVYSKWEEHIELRFAYAARDEYMPMNLFPELFRETFELIREINNEYIYQGKTFKDASVTMAYIDLIALISKYVIYNGVEDNSFRKYFTATSLITEGLIRYATRVGQYRFPDNNTVVYCDTDEEHNGIFEFDSGDYCVDDEESTVHIYNVYNSNIEDMVALAAKMA